MPRTAQEVQEILEARKRYKATPEGRKAGAAFAASIAKAKAEQKDKARRQARIDAAASQSVENAGLMLELEEERRTDRAQIVDLSESRQQAEHTTRKTEAEKARIAADAEAQSDRADRAETEAEQLKNRFGLPHGQAEFIARELHEIAQKNGYKSGLRAFQDALSKRELGGGTRIHREEAEQFLSDFLPKSRNRKAA